MRVQPQIGRGPLHHGDRAGLRAELTLVRRASGVERQHRLHRDTREPAEQSWSCQAAPARERGRQHPLAEPARPRQHPLDQVRGRRAHHGRGKRRQAGTRLGRGGRAAAAVPAPRRRRRIVPKLRRRLQRHRSSPPPPPRRRRRRYASSPVDDPTPTPTLPSPYPHRRHRSTTVRPILVAPVLHQSSRLVAAPSIVAILILRPRSIDPFYFFIFSTNVTDLTPLLTLPSPLVAPNVSNSNSTSSPPSPPNSDL